MLIQVQHPVAYINRTLSPKNQLLSVYDNELLALIHAVEKWHAYLTIQSFIIRTDQKSLRYLLNQKLTMPSQLNWLTKLMGMNYEIQYKRGKENVGVDALSRVTHGEILQLSVTSVSSELWELIKEEWTRDPHLVELIKQVQQQPSAHPKYKWEGGILTCNSKLEVGFVLQTKSIILDWLHTSPVGGHSSIRATKKRIQVLFYWKGMLRDIQNYILKCETCLRCKNETVASPGLLQPLPIPHGVWHSIAMDFIKGLPNSKGKDVIWVVVDRLSEYAYFITLTHPISVVTLAQVFIDQIYKLHGASANIVSDRDPLFVSTFWREFLGQLGVTQSMSSAYHPQSDGQSEVLNRCLENYLRALAWQKPQEWCHWLSMAEWWYNTTFHSAINTNPYEVVYGQAPPLHLPYLPHES